MTSEAMAGTPPVSPGVFTLPPYDKKPPVLLGGYCRKCDKHYFPRRSHCPFCLEPMREASLGSKGRIYSFTVVRAKPPLGLPQPYAVGYIDLESVKLRIFCLLDPAQADGFRIGMEVKLAVDAIGHDGRGQSCLRPYFTPANAG
jgi:uncharacterized protein